MASIGARRRRALRPEGRLGRHRRGQRPQQLRLGRRRVPLDRRRRRRGPTSGSRAARPSRASSSIPRTRRPRGSRSRATSGTPSAERGLYKTTDGGETWKARARPRQPRTATGSACGDVAIDPSNPETLYAALYARPPHALVVRLRRRTPPTARTWAGIFKSTDGGATWKKLDRRACPARTRRIGLAVYAKDPKIVYAVVQSDEGGTSDIDDVAQQGGRRLPLRRRRRDLDADEPRSTRARSTSARSASIPRNDQRVYVLGFMRPRLGRRRDDLPRGPLQERPPRLPRARHRPAQARSACSSAPTAALYQSFDGGEALGAPEPHRRRASTTGSTST